MFIQCVFCLNCALSFLRISLCNRQQDTICRFSLIERNQERLTCSLMHLFISLRMSSQYPKNRRYGCYKYHRKRERERKPFRQLARCSGKKHKPSPLPRFRNPEIYNISSCTRNCVWQAICKTCFLARSLPFGPLDIYCVFLVMQLL